MQRDGKVRILKTLDTYKQYNNLIFFDCEARVKDYGDKQEHIFRMAWVCYVRYTKKKKYEKWQFCQTPDELYSFLVSKVKEKRKLYVLSHNIWYDMRVGLIFNKLIKDGYKLTKFVNQNMAFILEVRKEKKTICFLNFAQFFPMKLKAIGKAIGLEKLEEAWDSEDDEACSTYCRRDVEVLVRAWDLWRNFIITHKLGKQAYTLAGQALIAYRTRFLDKLIEIHNNPKVDEIELESYYGGRTETFFIGEVKEKPIYVLDVNSLYPYVMREYKYPTALVGYGKSMKISELKNALEKGYLVIAKVLVKTSENYIPKRYKNRLIFPVGEFITTVPTETLKIALKNNNILKIYNYAVYIGDYIFKDYVNYFYNLKLQYEKEGNSAMRLFTKLFLNSLYGKFGQKLDWIEREEECDINELYKEQIIDYDTNNQYIVYSLLGKRFVIKRRAVLSKNSFVAIASHCTDYARNYINKLRNIAGIKNVYYMDTDSLFVNEEGYRNLKDYIGEKLGMLKLEYKTNKLIIYGLKDYETDDKVKRKGISDKAIRLTENTFSQTQFPKFWSDISKGLTENYFTYTVVKELKREYTKGRVLKSGKVNPFIFENDVNINEDNL